MLVGDPRIKTDNHNVRDSRQLKLAGLYPVKMPVPACYTEAMILLQLRDSRGHGSLGHWQAELLYLLDPTQIRGLNLDFQDLRTPFREYAVARSTEGAVAGHRVLCQVFLEMNRAKRIPPPDTPWEAGLGREWSEVLREYNIPFNQSDLE
jgi:hypothetical protein